MLRTINRFSLNLASRALAVRFGSTSRGDGHKKQGDNHNLGDHHDPEQAPLPARQVHEGKAVDPSVTIPDALGHSVGLERYELLKELEGDDDPFMTAARLVDEKSSKDKPTLVPSNLQSRMIGCSCSPDSKNLRYMLLFRGNPQRCNCGHWFALCSPEEYYQSVKGVAPSKAISAH